MCSAYSNFELLNLEPLNYLLAVNLRRVDIEAADQRDQVRDHNSLAQFVDDAHGRKRAGANPYAIGVLAAIADDVKAHVAARRFDAGITFTRGRSEFARHFGDRRTLWHHLETLAQNFAALLHLAYAHPVTIEAIAEFSHMRRADRDVEIQFRIDRVRNIAANIPLYPRTAHVRPDKIV